MIPPIGRDNIKANYQVGGGERGNVGASEISTMKTSIPFMASVTNPEPAEGGSNTELLESAFERGPHLIKHRDRAVTEEDFERLAKAASSYIARTKCFTEGNKLKILLIPKGEEDKPTPSLGLMRLVENYLLDRSLNLILPVSIVVQEPSYKEVRITVDVVPESIDQAIPLEKAIVKRLKGFLHPLTGGPEERGWEFGRAVHISDVYALLEGIKGVDHVEKLELNDGSADVEVKEDETVCSGEHRIRMKLGG
ncbi:MAG: baseplate J/gp47 family protein, partial [Proteobacteria bacterium]|nr:baseplate J/gp47 family protein [Pseudomonadota bacterium]